jgi:hypothetical protein
MALATLRCAAVVFEYVTRRSSKTDKTSLAT